MRVANCKIRMLSARYSWMKVTISFGRPFDASFATTVHSDSRPPGPALSKRGGPISPLVASRPSPSKASEVHESMKSRVGGAYSHQAAA